MSSLTVTVPIPAYCKWCRLTTEISVMRATSGLGVTLEHTTCGRIIAEISKSELHQFASIDLAQELVRRANANRGEAPSQEKRTPPTPNFMLGQKVCHKFNNNLRGMIIGFGVIIWEGRPDPVCLVKLDEPVKTPKPMTPSMVQVITMRPENMEAI